ncbi:hypothetical protein OAD83_04150 [Gammaproteobacteria bacterium]|nr:hypothetical protein [Gammaproteobacteria bacterium]
MKILFSKIAPSLPLLATMVFQITLVSKFGLSAQLDTYFIFSGFNAFFLAILGALTIYWAFPNFTQNRNRRYFDAVFTLAIIINIIVLLAGITIYYHTGNSLPIVLALLITPSIIISISMYSHYSDGDYITGSILNMLPSLCAFLVIIYFDEISLLKIVWTLVLATIMAVFFSIKSKLPKFSLYSLGLLNSSESKNLFRSSIVSKSISPIDRTILSFGPEGYVTLFALFERIIMVGVTLSVKYHEVILLSSNIKSKKIIARFFPILVLLICCYYLVYSLFYEYFLASAFYPESLKSIETFFIFLVLFGPIYVCLLWLNSLVVAELYKKNEHKYIFLINLFMQLIGLLLKFLIIIFASFTLLPLAMALVSAVNLLLFYNRLKA